jgi:drug/metabolite transporter superfamily protein YnfA
MNTAIVYVLTALSEIAGCLRLRSGRNRRARANVHAVHRR